MKLTLYNAISVDGFIATKDGDTSWVADADWEVFESLCYQYRNLVCGRRTYEEMTEDPDIDQTKINYHVLTSDPQSHNQFKYISQLVDFYKENKVEEALLIGGGIANASLLKEKLITDMILSVHPIILGEGIRLFESDGVKVELDKVDVKELSDDLVHIYYRVKY
ncbi:dihydrofolate reductase family protein [Candidatus Dojkabacteria bacterium]|uniref:Dihydrofolate reductase family protein n=1 Tax=Candidatus Dojkabacteria bacterium TaxID=2099670 RepID=A0A955I9V7_9BACT|nr:dihydrofolate reductase family protein [Candidatus Dojkabacteria bacterium]